MATTPHLDIRHDPSHLLDAIRDITPDVTFDQTFEQSYLMLCEHHNYTRHEIDAVRKTIQDSDYWKYEALFLKTLLSDQTFDNIDKSVQKVNLAESTRWQCIASAYNQRLYRQGLTKSDIASRRLQIESQQYWKPEAEHLRQFAAQRESEWQEAQLVSASRDEIGGNPKIRHTKRLQQSQKRRRPRLTLKFAYRRTGSRSSDKSGG